MQCGRPGKRGGQGGEHKNEIRKPTPDYTLSAVCADGLGDTANTRPWGLGPIARIQRGRPDERGGQGEVDDVENQKLTGDCALSAVCADGLGDTANTRAWGPGLVVRIQRGHPDEQEGQGEIDDVKNRKLTGDCALSAMCANGLGDDTNTQPWGPGLVARIQRGHPDKWGGQGEDDNVEN